MINTYSPIDAKKLQLEAGMTLPFKLFVYQQNLQINFLINDANIPLTTSTLTLIDEILKYNGQLTIQSNQIKTINKFYNTTILPDEVSVEDSEQLATPQLQYTDEEIWNYLQKETFEPLLPIVQYQVEQLGISSLTRITQRFLKNVNAVSKIIVTAHFVLSKLEVDRRSYENVMLALILRDCGKLLLPFDSANLSSEKLSGYTQYFLRKTKIKISDKCMKLILNQDKESYHSKIFSFVLDIIGKRVSVKNFDLYGLSLL